MEKGREEMQPWGNLVLVNLGADGPGVREVFLQLHVLLSVRQADGLRHIQLGRLSCRRARKIVLKPEPNSQTVKRLWQQ